METGLVPLRLVCHTLCTGAADYSRDTRKWFRLTSEHITASVSMAHLAFFQGVSVSQFASDLRGCFSLPGTM